MWSEPGGYVARRGYDASGRFYAQVQGQNGRYGVYFAPWAVSDSSSQRLDGFDTVEEAMEAADRYVAGYLDAAGVTTCSAGQMSDAGPQRRYPVAGWLMGVRFTGRSDDGGGHLAGGRTGPT